MSHLGDPVPLKPNETLIPPHLEPDCPMAVFIILKVGI
jgi:hypothetical protein